MSDQISEKMARNVYYSGTSGEWRELEDEFIANLKRKGLIKPSKLDEVREWVASVTPGKTVKDVGRYVGVRECAAQYEQAILKDRK